MDELKSIEDQEKKLTELKEFATFEISKIDAIKPTIGEDEELNIIKKQLSKKEKIQEAIQSADEIFRFENHVSNALSLLDEESSFFDDAMNELRGIFENALEKLEMLEEISIETVLDRIELLSELKRRYGGIQEALDYREQKALELESYQTIEYSKTKLIQQIAKLEIELESLAQELSLKRQNEIKITLEKLNQLSFNALFALRHVEY